MTTTSASGDQPDRGAGRRITVWLRRTSAVVVLAMVGVVGAVAPAQAAVTTHVVSWEAGEPAWQYINWGHWVGRDTYAGAVRSGNWGVRMLSNSMQGSSPGEARRTFTYATHVVTCAAQVYVRNNTPASQRVRVGASRTNGVTLKTVTATLPANSGWTLVSLGSFQPSATAFEISLYALPFPSTGFGSSYWADIGWDDFTMSCIRF